MRLACSGPLVPFWRLAAPAALLLCAYTLPSLAQDDPELPQDAAEVATEDLDDTAGAASQNLQSLEAEIALTEERIAEIRAEIEALDGDASRLGAELAAAGQRVELAGDDVRIIEERLEELFARERTIRERLSGHDDSIGNLLASLQRVTVQPPPAMIVDPADALGSARAAMLLGAVLPQLQQKANTVAEDLSALVALKEEALEEAELLEANLRTLNEERLRIATIIEARNRGREWLSEDLIREEAEAQALADRATSLEQLIEGLEARIAAVTAAGAATRAANAGREIPTLDPETIELAFADESRTEPAVPIEAAKGYLMPPANGVAIMTYGAADGFGGTSKGISLATRADAPVIAPADGWVVFTGPFLNYGQIIILNAGQDYLIVLAGLDQVEVERGAFVRMGTRIGAMGERSIAQRYAGAGDASGPALYVELREGGIPIDPAGWWTARPAQQESGSS